LIESDDQPDKVTNLGDPLVWSQFTNSLYPGMIEVVDRHSAAPDFCFLVETNLPGFACRSTPFFVKLSGG